MLNEQILLVACLLLGATLLGPSAATAQPWPVTSVGADIGRMSGATGINDLGQVVGNYLTTPSGPTRGFVWHASDVTNMVTVDLDGAGRTELVVSFAGGSVSIYRNGSTWERLHTLGRRGDRRRSDRRGQQS